MFIDIIKKNKDKIIAFLLIAILYLFFYISGIGCPIKFLTGISCAGCGMTRAFLSLFKLQFKDAFYYHPLWWLVILDVIFWFYKKKLESKEDYSYSRKFDIVIIISILMFLVVYLFRLLDRNNDIVTFDLESGIIYKLLDLLF